MGPHWAGQSQPRCAQCIDQAQAALFNERLQRLAADFSQQHVADQKLPASEKCAYTVVLGMRSWLFAPFRDLLRPGA